MGMINQFFIGIFSYPASLNCLRFFINSEIVLQVETMAFKICDMHIFQSEINYFPARVVC